VTSRVGDGCAGAPWSDRSECRAPASHYERLTFITPDGTLDLVIESFRDKTTGSVWNQVPVRRPALQVQRMALRKLIMLHRAKELTDLRVSPGNRLERLRGDGAGELSIRVNGQWRIRFRWGGGDATDVELTDYR
jgi:proteic killer suppression protein